MTRLKGFTLISALAIYLLVAFVWIYKTGVLASVLPPELNRSLAIGARGEDVRALQEFLASDPALYPEGYATGYFGTLTKRAVERFQSRNGIEAVGIVGPKTKAALVKIRNILLNPSVLPSATPTPSPTVTAEPSPSPTPTPTPTPTPDPLSLIRTGSGTAAINEVIKIGAAEFWYVAQDASKGRGYLAPPPSGNAADVANMSAVKTV